jgi:hypothetical protein
VCALTVGVVASGLIARTHAYQLQQVVYSPVVAGMGAVSGGEILDMPRRRRSAVRVTFEKLARGTSEVDTADCGGYCHIIQAR